MTNTNLSQGELAFATPCFLLYKYFPMKKQRLHKSAVIAVFILLGFLAMQVPFSKLLGVENLKFSLFDFYGPIAGAFLGSIWGVATVLAMQIVNWAVHGFATDTGTLIRFLPVLFAVLYFAKNTKWTLAVPLLAMLAFWAHPEGRGAWYFALYWTIPLFMHPLRERFVFARALGATFTQHSVGGALWVWAFGMKSSIWLSLIPVVWKERVLMALGITLTYALFNYLFGLIRKKTRIELSFIQLHHKFLAK